MSLLPLRRGVDALLPGQRRLMTAVLLALFAWLAYLNSLHNPFVFDDHRLILENHSLAELNELPAIVWRDVTRPLINLSYAFDLWIWGPRPLGFHVTNVLLHAVNVLWVFYLARTAALDAGRRSLVEVTADADADVIATASALLFAWHPMLTQAVGYVSGRSELLCAALMLPAFMAARRFLLGGGRRWLATALALWLASMTAKEVGAMLPFLLLAYERLLLPDAAGARRRLVTLYLPWIGCTLLAAGVRVWILTTIEYPTDRVDSTLALVAVDAMRRYLLMLVRPAGQSIFHALYPIAGLSDPRALIAIGAVSGVAAFAFAVRRLDWLIPFGFCWFFLVMVPSSALFVLGRGEAFAEHRVYVASIGVFMAAGAIVHHVLAFMRNAPRYTRWLVYVVLAVIGLQMVSRTFVRNAIWSSPVALWRESVALAPNHWLPRLMLGEVLREQEGCTAAVPEYRQAIALRPEESFALKKLGECFVEMRRIEDAAQVFQLLSTTAPASPDGPTGLGIVAMLDGDVAASRARLEDAIARDSTTTLARRLLATLEEPVDPVKAERLCQEIQSLAPRSADAEWCARRTAPPTPDGSD
ncbi:MAG TPA: tetratricopeptide repeat protein [Vicinamibacterales bacterium]|nr:tetratricopeptide repeat protein [Vicinamibacterales bacterium]